MITDRVRRYLDMAATRLRKHQQMGAIEVEMEKLWRAMTREECTYLAQRPTLEPYGGAEEPTVKVRA